jgi:hypothetical protein
MEYITYPISNSEEIEVAEARIEKSWMEDKYGLVDIHYFVDCCTRYPSKAVTKCLDRNRKFPVCCRYPDEVNIE